MPKPYPKEFRDKVVRVAVEPRGRCSDSATSLRTSGSPSSCLGNWLAEARRGGQEPEALTELAELREAKKRIRLLEQENEVLRRAGRVSGAGELPKG